MTKCVARKGFTLIELLVVVLIIGILAAIALPQYQKAVWPARAMELVTLVSNTSKARQLAYLRDGNWTADFPVLDIQIPLSLNCDTYVGDNCVDGLGVYSRGFCEKVMHGKKEFEVPAMGIAGYSF